MFKNLHGFNSGAEMTENRIYGFADQKKKKLNFCNLKTQRKKKMKRNLGICGSVRKYSTSASSEFKKKKRRRAKVNKHPERD